MATRISAEETTKTISQRRFGLAISGWGLRLLVAFIISWLIVLAFFATSVVSH